MLEDFLAGLASAPAALVLAGEAGAGKTTLLRAGVDHAAGRGYTVLRTQPSRRDMRLAFAGLADLLGGHLDVVLPGLPAPQRRALGAALLIDDAPPTPPEPRVIAAALRNALLVLAASAPVLVVIDDVQWLDAPTGSAAGFALRRVAGAPVGLLCAQRTDSASGQFPLELDRSDLVVTDLPLGALSVGALHRVLRIRLRQSFSQPTLRRIHAESAGNPFIALEIGGALTRRGITRVASGPLPVPETLSGLVGERLGELPPAVLHALDAVAVMPDAPVDRYLAAGVPGSDLDAAVRAGVVEEDAGRLRFSHPLLASAVLGAIPPARRRQLHALAAASGVNAEEKARHLALSADSPSDEIAAGLDEAARLAELRGAPATAAELFELAASLTPGDHADDRHKRLLDAGRLLAVAGETRAAAALLRRLADTAPSGPRRAEALARLGWNSEDDFEVSTRLLQDALAEAGEAPLLRASIHSFLADHWTIRGEAERGRAEAHRALDYAERAGDPALLASLLGKAFLFDWMCGHMVDERQLERALEIEERLGPVGLVEPPSEWAGMYLMGMGRLAEARAALERVLARSEAEGAEYVRADVLLRLSLIATRTGDPHRGAELAQTGLAIAEQLDLGQLTSALLFGCGFAALHLGQPGQARERARRGIDLSRKAGDRVYMLANEALLGSVDLALGEFGTAAARLRPLVGENPGVRRRPTNFQVLEAIEALIGAGDLDEAESVLAGLGDTDGSPVMAAGAARCRGALASARGRADEAVAELTSSLRIQDRLTPEPVQRGRTLLVLGSVRRRLRQRRAARETLAEAIELFDSASAALWAGRAREEIARVSGRVPGTGQLSETELRVAELVSRGMTNRAVAAELFVSVRTVESTLTKIYAKVGVRSRTQLARAMRDRAVERIADESR